RAVGLHQIAIYCGVILGGFGGYVSASPHLGWRFAFHAAGLFGIAYAIPLLFLLRDAPEPAGLEADIRLKPTTWSAAGELVGNFSFILLVLYFTLPALAGWVIRDWMPNVLEKRFPIGAGLAGVSAALPVNLAALAGAFIGGWAADSLMRHT